MLSVVYFYALWDICWLHGVHTLECFPLRILGGARQLNFRCMVGLRFGRKEQPKAEFRVHVALKRGQGYYACPGMAQAWNLGANLVSWALRVGQCPVW